MFEEYQQDSEKFKQKLAEQRTRSEIQRNKKEAAEATLAPTKPQKTRHMRNVLTRMEGMKFNYQNILWLKYPIESIYVAWIHSLNIWIIACGISVAHHLWTCQFVD